MVQTPEPSGPRSTQDHSSLPLEFDQLYGFPLGNSLHTQQCIHRSLWVEPTRKNTRKQLKTSNQTIWSNLSWFWNFIFCDFVTSPSEFLNLLTAETENADSIKLLSCLAILGISEKRNPIHCPRKCQNFKFRHAIKCWSHNGLLAFSEFHTFVISRIQVQSYQLSNL